MARRRRGASRGRSSEKRDEVLELPRRRVGGGQQVQGPARARLDQCPRQTQRSLSPRPRLSDAFGLASSPRAREDSRHVWRSREALFVRCLAVVVSSGFPLRRCTSSIRPPQPAGARRPMQPASHPDAPPLALDDIIHTMSPSPTPQSLPPEPPPPALPEQIFPPVADSLDSTPVPDTSMPPPRIPSPEPLDLSELESMRARVQEYTLTLDSTNQRESDLAAMVRPSASSPTILP